VKTKSDIRFSVGLILFSKKTAENAMCSLHKHSISQRSSLSADKSTDYFHVEEYVVVLRRHQTHLPIYLDTAGEPAPSI